jgi:hypothetical protein
MQVANTALAVLTAGIFLVPDAAHAQAAGAGQARLVAATPGMSRELACVPYLTFASPADGLRVTGSLDLGIKRMMGPGDTLVVNGGSGQGLQAGQEFFVRRLSRSFGSPPASPTSPLIVHGVAWIRLLTVEAAFSTAAIVHACDGILLDDYLEPYQAPLVATAPIDGEPHVENFGRVVLADEGSVSAATGGFLTINRGSDHGVRLGQRFSVFRDNGTTAPPVDIGTLEAVLVQRQSSTVKVLDSRDAVARGDLVAIRR